jgi:hypothetical protein
MGAGNASASLYKSNPNLNTFGGSKKQDIATRVGIDAWANYGYQTNANGIGRNKLFIMNQIGGVGVGRSMFNTSYVQPRGLRKTVDISDIAYWDGVQHVLKNDTIIPVGHSLKTTSTFTVGQGTTLTVLGNFQSQGHIIVQGVLNIKGTHDHKKMTILSTGFYNVYGTSIGSADIEKYSNTGTIYVAYAGSYTNNGYLTNYGKIINEGTFNNGTVSPSSLWLLNSNTITNNGGVFNNYATLQNERNFNNDNGIFNNYWNVYSGPNSTFSPVGTFTNEPGYFPETWQPPT